MLPRRGCFPMLRPVVSQARPGSRPFFPAPEAMIRRSVTVLSFVLSVTTHAGAQQRPVESRLDGFDEYVARLLETWNVPGIGVGIVVKQQLVFARGYGFRDYGKKLPYTPTTTQPIASNTKLFTAVAAGLLVEDGKLDWDKPIRTYVPSVKFSSDDLDRTITMRDMLSHRTGIAGHNGIWYKSDFTQKDIFDRLRFLDSSAPPRTTFLYNNVMYSAAGLRHRAPRRQAVADGRDRAHPAAARHDAYDVHDRRHGRVVGGRGPVLGAARQ